MKLSFSVFTFPLMFASFVAAIPLPDSIDYEKPSALLPRISFDRYIPLLSSTRRSRKLDDLQGYDVYHLRDLEDPVFVSALQFPAEAIKSEGTVATDDNVATVEPAYFNRIRPSTDATTWDILTLARKQSEKLGENLR